MREFFKGWKRKAGSVTLVLACVFTLGWVRSYHVEDRLAFTSGSFRHAIGSFQGNIAWDRWLDNAPSSGLAWSSAWLNLNTPSPSRPTNYKAAPGSLLGGLQFESRSVPYWPFVVPLTLVAAWLMLSKPRAATSPPMENDMRGPSNANDHSGPSAPSA